MLPFLPKRAITEEALLKVERRWVESDMPDSEILDALCQCYLTLRKVVRDAHDALANPLPGKCAFLDRATTTNEARSALGRPELASERFMKSAAHRTRMGRSEPT